MKRKSSEGEKKEVDKRKKYHFDIKKIKEELEENGYAVVPKYVNDIETERIKKSLIKFICGLNMNGNLDENDRKTWTNKNLPFNIHGIIKHYGIGQCQALWDIREHLADLFEAIHGTSKLLTSFDGACLLVPNSKCTEAIHTDQSPIIERKDKDFISIQGIFNMEDCGENDGGLVVYKGSHKQHSKYFDDNNINSKENWYIFDSKKVKNETGVDFLEKFKRIKVCCKAGDVLLFDSRTAHTVTPSTNNFRIAAYVSMLPICYSDEKKLEKELERKKKYFKEIRTTSHWACKFLSVNPKKPRWGKEGFRDENDDSFVKPILTTRMKQLAGLINYH